ncbi:hypothetical protein LTR27_010693 [Elasticomyces elasticus]|nr:hypothetical protein LTR27_010693 [Elasticomyces elasticus]
MGHAEHDIDFDKKDNIRSHIVGQDQPIDEKREANEVFKLIEDGVDFRTVSWQRAAIIFLKIQFAMSILSVPGSMAVLGAVGGALSIVGWDALNTYTAVVLGDFRNRHPECHTLADMCARLWGRAGRELVGAQLLIGQVLITAGGIVSVSTAFNALSDHGACTVVFSFVAAALITLFSSVRTFSRLGWLTWFGFATFFVAVFIFVVAVTQQERPAAAPPTGPFELGWTAIAYPGFVAGITASANLFIFSSGSSMYLPVISEMRRPQDYRKAAILTGLLVGAMYLSFSLVIYRWCGIWIATPAFGSAGTLFKKISYGIALPGTNLVLGALGFIIAEAVPILNYLLGLAGSLCFAPFSLIFPALLWMQDYRSYRSGSGTQRAIYGAHALIVLIGAFMVVGGTYGVAVSIKQAYASGMIGKAFDCADNSGSSS